MRRSSTAFAGPSPGASSLLAVALGVLPTAGLAICGLALGFLSTTAAAQQSPLVLRPGESISSQILDGDPAAERVETERLNTRYTQGPTLGRTVRLELGEPGTYTLELWSGLFDAYLVVRDAGGNLLAEDDDGRIGTQARVVIESADGATLLASACALHGRRGAFELSLRRGAPEDLDAAGRRAADLDDARRCLAAREQALGPDHLQVAESLNRLAMLLVVRGEYAEALPLYERALAIWEREHGPEHRLVARTLFRVADMHRRLGQHEQARPLFERALAVQERIPDADETLVAATLNGLGLVLRATGEYAEARRHYERALPIAERALAPDSDELASVLLNYSGLLTDLAEYDEAARLAERGLAIREGAKDPDPRKVSDALVKLANVHREVQRFDEAIPLLERALALREAALGPDALDLVEPLSALAGQARREGRFDESRALYLRAIGIGERAPEREQSGFAVLLANYATLLRQLGEYAEARALYERALDIAERTLGPEHPEFAAMLNNFALLLRTQGDIAAARLVYERAFEITERTLGPDHPRVGDELNDLASLRTVVGDYAGARALHERALAIHERAFGPDHVIVAHDLNGLGSLLYQMRDAEGAIARLERALAIEERERGAESPEAATCLSNLAKSHGIRGRHDEARALHERALAIRERVYGPDHPLVATSVNGVAVAEKNLGNLSKARPLYERALGIVEQALGPEHPDVAACLDNLAGLLRATGSPTEARALDERALAIRERAFGPDHPLVASSLTGLAMSELDLGHAEAAFDLIRRATASRANIQRQWLSASNEADALSQLEHLARQVELQQSPVVRALGPTESYEGLLAWKGQVLRAACASREASRQRLGEEGRRLADRLAALSCALSRGATELGRDDAPPDPAALGALSEQYQKTQRELAALTTGALPALPSWAELRDALPEGAALVDLFVHREYEAAPSDGAPRDAPDGGARGEGGRWSKPRVTAWITRAGAAEPVAVGLGPSAAIEAAGRVALAPVASRGEPLRPAGARPAGATGSEPASASASPSASGLEALIWEPLRPHLEGLDTVIVSPDGALATVPFEILRAGDRYLVEELSFVYLVDPTQLARVAETRAPVAPGLLCVGDVDFERAQALDDERGPPSPRADSGAPGRGWASGWAALPATAAEADAVLAAHAAAFPSARRQGLRGAEASEEALKRALPAHGVVHLATHGYFDPEGLAGLMDVGRRLEAYNPGLLSGLVCAGANAGPPPPRDDGFLTAEEVGWLDLSGCDLVVLSACDTGLGRPQSGEGLLGLRRAFLTAGARTVISSLWAVPDQETAELMGLFYENLWNKQMGQHASLRAAQLEMIRRNRERHGGDARPATWGAFVVDGDWQ